MRIATWNVNGLRARLEYITKWLEDRQPDVVGFQELKTPDDVFPIDHFKELGYEALVHGQKSWNGVAILSKHPTELVHTGLAGQNEVGSRLITADIDGKFEFTTVYCPNGKNLEHADYAGKLGWYDSLNKQWRSGKKGPRIICGDFNIVPEPIDGWKGEAADGGIFHTKEERARLQSLMDTGLTDLYRHLYPEEQAFTWWDYRGGSFHRKHGLRIDFILATEGVDAVTKDVVIDRDYRRKIDELTPSDHAPVYADIDF